MGLHELSDDRQTLYHHCPNPDCKYHNCAAWGDWLECKHHDAVEHVVVPAHEMQAFLKGKIPDEMLAEVGDTLVKQRSTEGRIAGETREIPITHPDIEYTDHDLVALPTCECGSRTFLKVKFTEQELQAPNIRRIKTDPNDPTRVVEVSQHPMVSRHQVLHEELQKIGKRYQAEKPIIQKARKRTHT